MLGAPAEIDGRDSFGNTMFRRKVPKVNASSWHPLKKTHTSCSVQQILCSVPSVTSKASSTGTFQWTSCFCNYASSAFSFLSFSGKARKGDGNDLTPNPRKLWSIGKELDRLNKVIAEMTPVADVPSAVKSRSRKEKNKLASR